MLPFYENKPDAVYAFRNSNMVFPPHLHIVTEIMYVIQGEVAVEIDGSTAVLGPGAVSVAFPNQVHSYESVTSETLLILVPLSAVGHMASTVKGKRPASQFLHNGQLSAHVRAAFEALAAAPEGFPPQELEALAHLVFVHTVQLLGLATADDTELSLTGRAVALIADHYRTPITQQWAAQQLHVSKCYLSRQMHAFLKMGFCEYVNCMRVDCAKNLLRDSALSVTEVALESGFENPRTFNRAFRAATGITPREFRRG